MRQFVIVLLLAAALAAVPAACDFGLFGGPSGPGVIEVTVQSPYGAEGAAVLLITGGTQLSIVASPVGDTFYQHTGDATRAVVVLDDPGEIRFTVRTENIGDLPSVTFVQVAGGDNALRTDLAGYKVTFRQLEDLTSQDQVRTP